MQGEPFCVVDGELVCREGILFLLFLIFGMTGDRRNASSLQISDIWDDWFIASRNAIAFIETANGLFLPFLH